MLQQRLYHAMPTESDNHPAIEFNPTAGIPKTSYNEKSAPSYDNITWFSTVQPPVDLVNKKEKTMTDTQTLDTPVEFSITETVKSVGYVDQDGKFHEGAKPADAFVQVGEDAQ